MKIKEKEHVRVFAYMGRHLSNIYKGIAKSSVPFFFKTSMVIGIFLFGIVIGLLATGFFGTLDNPSPKALAALHDARIEGFRLKMMSFGSTLSSLKEENVHIPLNYIKGKLSSPKKLFIDIGFEDYQKLEYKRRQAIGSLTFTKPFQPYSGVLIKSDDDTVPAQIRYGDKTVKVKLRLKGDITDHLEGDKWSFRIEVKGDDTLFGMGTFSIQDPAARGILDQFVYHRLLEREGLMALRYDFVEVVINGENKGIFALEEHFDKYYMGNNRRRESVILKFDDSGIFLSALNVADELDDAADYSEFVSRNFLDFFYASAIEPFDEKRVFSDPVLSSQFREAQAMLELFRRGDLTTSEVFDIDLLARYYAINTLMGDEHPTYWHNLRFYYNPVTSLLEPVGYDSLGVRDAHEKALQYFFFNYSCGLDCTDPMHRFSALAFRDDRFYARYLAELERMSDPRYLDALFSDLEPELSRHLDVIYKDTPTYHFSRDAYYQNQMHIRNKLRLVDMPNSHFQGYNPASRQITVAIGNVNPFPLEILGVTYPDAAGSEVDSSVSLLPAAPAILDAKLGSGPVRYQEYRFVVPNGMAWNESSISDMQLRVRIVGTSVEGNGLIFPWPNEESASFDATASYLRTSTLSSFPMLAIDEETKTISIPRGEWIVDHDLVVPAGYVVMAGPGTTLNLRGNASIISYSPLRFLGGQEDLVTVTSLDHTGGGVIVIHAGTTSVIQNTIFSNLQAVMHGSWSTSGAVTFYGSPVHLKDTSFLSANSEDSLHIMNTNLIFERSTIQDATSDCLDMDFGIGIIRSSTFIRCGNDGVDVSGSSIKVEDVDIVDAGDKGVSGGESSLLLLDRVSVDGQYIGIASKDLSVVGASHLNLSNLKYGIVAYQKKSEFGPAEIVAVNTTLSDISFPYFIEKGSTVQTNDAIIEGAEENVYEVLYP